MSAPTVYPSDHAQLRWQQRGGTPRALGDAWDESDPIVITDDNYHGMGRHHERSGTVLIVKNDRITTVLYDTFLEYDDTTEDHWQQNYEDAYS